MPPIAPSRSSPQVSTAGGTARTTSCRARSRQCGIEPQVGGRVWEENDAGDTCTWGRVLVWDPPRTFAYSWLIGTDWGVPADDAAGSTVTVTFTPTDAGTHVDLVHDHLDVHGEGWEQMRDSISSDGGWNSLLRLYAAAI